MSTKERKKDNKATSAPITRYVCPTGCDYASIQAAVDAADPADIIAAA
jgi:hypothetical protein